MKYLIVLGDGMADRPQASLGGLTPLQAARTPNIDTLARLGRSGTMTTVPAGMHPGSEVANMAVLGYDVARLYEGRGVLEAASMGVDVPAGTVAMRCNLITLTDGTIVNHSAGHITTPEATELIRALQHGLGSDRVQLHPGVSYRHLLLLPGADKRVACTPPHDVPGQSAAPHMPRALHPGAAPTAALITDLIARSQEILARHPVNLARMAAGKAPATSIWPWSPGYRPDMQPLTATYPITDGVVISAVDLIFGIGHYAGLRGVTVEGATGLHDTNYEGKAAAAIEALRGGSNFVFLHVEASDEAGHEGDAALKKRTIEYLDSRILGPVMEAAATLDEPLTIAVLPDHPTPCDIRTHTSEPVPFLIFSPGAEPDRVEAYDEFSAANGSYGHIDASQFMPLLFSNR